MNQPLKAVDTLLQNIEKQFGKGAMMRLGDRKAERVPCIPSGCPSLDEALGCGGYPKGRVVEVFGPESSGKTTLTLHAIAQCQAMNGVAAFIDAEHALDVHYAQNLGVNAKELLVSQPDSGEQALDIAEILVRSGTVDLVVIDSVAALVPRAELEGDMGASHVGLQARLMSQALRKLSGAAHRTGTTLVFINQLRMKIGVMFGPPKPRPEVTRSSTTRQCGWTCAGSGRSSKVNRCSATALESRSSKTSLPLPFRRPSSTSAMARASMPWVICSIERPRSTSWKRAVRTTASMGKTLRRAGRTPVTCSKKTPSSSKPSARGFAHRPR
jgi:RecA/RadA recombinase